MDRIVDRLLLNGKNVDFLVVMVLVPALSHLRGVLNLGLLADVDPGCRHWFSSWRGVGSISRLHVDTNEGDEALRYLKVNSMAKGKN